MLRALSHRNYQLFFSGQSISLVGTWMTRIAKVYELQDNFLRMQNVAVDQLSGLPLGGGASGKQVAATLIPRFSALDQLARGLSGSYAEALGAPANSPR